jgi:hypothetical protein
MRLLVVVGKSSPALSRRGTAVLIAAAFCVFVLPTLRPAPIVAQGPTAAAGDSQSKPTDDRDAAEQLWTARAQAEKKKRNAPPELDIFFPPFHVGSQMLPLDEFRFSDEQTQKLRQICADYNQQLNESRKAQRIDWEKLTPPQREAKARELQANSAKLNAALGKRIDEVLTAEQQAAVKRAILQLDALIELRDAVEDHQPSDSLQLQLSDGQKKQLAKLYSDSEKQQENAARQFPNKLLAVLTREQRAKLSEGVNDLAPQVDVPDAGDVSRVWSYRSDGPPNPYLFWFSSHGGSSVTVYAESDLSDARARKELRLSDAQEAKLRAVHASAQSAADTIFNTYDVEPAALAKLSLPARKEKEAEFEEKRDEFRRKLTELGNDTRRQIDAVLDKEQLAAVRNKIRMQRALPGLMSANRKTRDAIGATQQQREKLLELVFNKRAPFDPDRETGEKALAILSPEQRQKLVKDIESKGSL